MMISVGLMLFVLDVGIIDNVSFTRKVNKNPLYSFDVWF